MIEESRPLIWRILRWLLGSDNRPKPEMGMGVYQVWLAARRPGFWSLSLERRIYDVFAADPAEAESLAIDRAKAEGFDRVIVDRASKYSSQPFMPVPTLRLR